MSDNNSHKLNVFFSNFLFASQGQYVWEDHRPRNGVYKGTSGGEAFCFSGCDDNQTSADTSVSFNTSLFFIYFCCISLVPTSNRTKVVNHQFTLN